MDSNRNVCLFFAPTYVIFIGLIVLVAGHPISFRNWLGSWGYDIKYRLNAWSQYDNPEEGTAREGDIKSPSRKTMTKKRASLWPNGIVRYFIDKTITNEPDKLAILRDAMNNIMELTCVRFVHIYPDSLGKFPVRKWVNITGNKEGCFADLGYPDTSPSTLNLNVEKCFRTRGHAIHEILHTLGAFHEHMRPDRDDHIRILWENIKEGDEDNFRMMDENTVTTHGLPYDYESIMHYSMTAFSKNKTIPTIVPRRSSAEIGQRNYLSQYDIQKLRRAYQCHKRNPPSVFPRKKLNRTKKFHSKIDQEAKNPRKSETFDPLHESKVTWNPWTMLGFAKPFTSFFSID
ncbi:zinc metalloproteinase nas-14-like [Venturia canescens]|uniref:zinc metalloproteinase nas-14-like n=1 Tax=Venturia canescens TaxID=32260 RepID=UPI001C9D3C7F|nr:zinc metalloproteinase nas-14-like [Venturia canescens]